MQLDAARAIIYSLVLTGQQHIIRSVKVPPGHTAEVFISGGYTSSPVYLAEGLNKDISPTLNPAMLAQLSHPVGSQLNVACSDGAKKALSIHLLPLCAWDQSREHAKATAAFVLENDPFVLRVLRKSGVSPSPGAAGRQVYAVAESLYNKLLETFEVCYLYERGLLPGYGDVQLVRFPAQMYYDVGGTCIDLALLLAAIFRAAGLSPVVLLLGAERGLRHALVGLWTDDQNRRHVTIPAEVLGGEIRLGSLLLIEATALTQYKPFSDALAMGQRLVSEERILWGVDIGVAREGQPPVLSLPEHPCTTILSGLPSPITDAFTTTKSIEASQVIGELELEVVASKRPGGAPKRWSLNGHAVRIGKTPHNQVMLEHPSVSREHAVLFSKDGLIYIKDLASRNGTYIDGAALEPYCPVVIRRGETFSLGEVELRLI